MANVEQERQKMEQNKQRVAFDARELVSSAEAVLRSTADYSGAEIEEARMRLRQQLDMAQDWAGEWTDAARMKYQRAVEMTDERVHEKPWTFIGVAFAVGMVMGHCMRGGSRC